MTLFWIITLRTGSTTKQSHIPFVFNTWMKIDFLVFIFSHLKMNLQTSTVFCMETLTKNIYNGKSVSAIWELQVSCIFRYSMFISHEDNFPWKSFKVQLTTACKLDI